MTEKYVKLNNPPISEVIIGFSYDNLFNSYEDINDFIAKLSDVTAYKETGVIHNVSFELGSSEMKLAKNVTLGSVICNENKTEQVHIELNKLMFIDKNKYSTFDNFIYKFNIILENLLKYTNSPVQINNVGLRYINKFLFSNEKLEKHFLIKQSSVIKEENESFAQIKNSLYISHYKSLKYDNIMAIVKTMREQANSASQNVIFDIDTHLNSSYIIDNIENFKNEILKLKEFKNQIFFSNFNEIQNIEEFQ